MILKKIFRKNLKRTISMTVAGMMCLSVLAGCGVGTDVSSDNEIFSLTSTRDMRRVKFEEPNNVIEGAVDIYVIPKSTNSSYWTPFIEGVRRSGLDNGCNIYMATGLDYLLWDAQKKLIEKAIEAEADAVVIAPENSSELNASLEELHEKGIAVILADNIANTDSFDVCYMTDNLKAGQDAAKELLTMMRMDEVPETDELDVAIIIGNEDSQAVNERLAGFLQYWSSNAPKTWSLADDIEAIDESVELAAETTRAVLFNDSKVRAIFTVDASSSEGAAKMIMQNSRTDIYLACFDYSPALGEIIRDENYNAITIVQNQYTMGTKSVIAAKSAAYGKEFSERFVDTGTLALRQNNIDDSLELKEMSQYKD